MNARRGIAALVAFVVALAATLLVTAAPAAADPVSIPTGTPLRLINYGSFKCVQPATGDGIASWDNGAPIEQLPCGLNVPNYWTAQYIGKVSKHLCHWYDLFCVDEWPVYRFSSNFSGKCLDIRGESTAAWTPMQQTTCTSGDQSMLWIVFPGDYNGTYTLRNFYSWLCLDVANSSTADGARLQQLDCTGNNPAEDFYYTP